MHELYTIFLDHSVAQFTTMGLVFFISIVWVYRLWSNAQLAHVKLTASENIQIYCFGAVALITAMVMFGYIAFPNNVENLLDMVNLKYPLFTLTSFVQRGILWVIRLFM